jgi:MFS family permease
MGLGSLIAALSMAALGRLSQRNLLIAASTFVILFVGVAVSKSYYMTAMLLVALGIVSVLFSTTVNTTLQITVPDELRGRVMSIFFLLFAGSTPVGGYLTGVLAEQVGVTKALLVMASLCSVGIAAAASYRQVTGAGRQPANVLPGETVEVTNQRVRAS